MAKASNTILLNDCLNFYTKSMQKAVGNIDPYFNQTELLDTHENLKDESLKKVKFVSMLTNLRFFIIFSSKILFEQFQVARKLGGKELISVFQLRTEEAIEEKLLIFKEENERKRVNYIVSIQFKMKTLNFYRFISLSLIFFISKFIVNVFFKEKIKPNKMVLLFHRKRSICTTTKSVWKFE